MIGINGHEDATGNTHAASGARPITREDEGRVRRALAPIFMGDRDRPVFQYDGDRLTVIAGEHYSAGFIATRNEIAARAGIVPGPDGWRWAAPAPIAKGDRLCSRTTGRVYTARAFLSDFTRYPGGPLQGPGWKLEDEDEDGMPAWETVSDLNNTEKWERVGPRLAPTVILDAPSQPAGMGEQRAIAAAVAGAAPADRPAALRAALLSVLSRGPVEGLARLLPALDAAMGEAPGVARATGAEARQAAREVGAVVDGARWSLPAMVPGWGWRLSYVPRCWFLTRLDAEDVEGGSVATVESEHGAWGWQLAGAPAWSEADSLAEAQSAALDAARRAGLFAPRSALAAAPASPVDTTPTRREPANPLRAAIQAIIDGEPGEAVEGHLAAWGAALVEQARASVEALPEIKAMRSPRVTIEGPTLREYADDGKTVVHEERVGSNAAPPLYQCWQAAQRVRDARREDGLADISDALDALCDLIDEAERGRIVPVQPCPSCAASAERATEAERKRDDMRRALDLGETQLAAAIEETRSAERAAAEARLDAEAAAAARDTLARDYAAERALSESLRAQLDEAETARDDARAALSDLRAALADLAARWAGGAA